MGVVLVSLPSGAGVVRCPNGAIVVTDHVRDGHGTELRAEDPYRPVKSWVNENQSVVGGLLPPGARSAEIVDDLGRRAPAAVGDGAYAALIAQPNDGEEPIVCCRDVNGTPVRRPLPAAYPSQAVTDTDEACPGCGSVDYEQYVPFEPWRGGRPGPGGTTIPAPVVVCRVCGHEECQGTFYAVATGEVSEDEGVRQARIARARAEARVQRWYAETMLLRAVSFPIYAAEGWPARIGGSASAGDTLTQVTIRHDDAADADPCAGVRHRLEVTTSVDESELAHALRHARETLEVWVGYHEPQLSWSGKSHAAITLWWAAHRRACRGLALAARSAERFITIDGTPHPFLILTASTGSWVAARTHQDLMVTIAGRGIDPSALTIEPVADPAARLLGPKPPIPDEPGNEPA
jgi:hypothetical protein